MVSISTFQASLIQHDVQFINYFYTAQPPNMGMTVVIMPNSRPGKQVVHG